MLLIVSVILLLIDFIIQKRNKKILKSSKKLEIFKIIKRLSGKIKFKKNINYYKFEKLLKDVGLNISVDMYYLLKVICAAAVLIIIIIINYLNQLSIIINISKLSIYNVKLSVNISTLFMIFSIMLFIPDLILKQIVKIKGVIAQKEILILQTYTVILIKTGKNVKEILQSLFERSKIFKHNFEYALNTFSSDPDESLGTLKESTEIKSFKKIIIALEQCLNSDRVLSLIFLRDSRKITKELSRLEKLRKDGNKRIFNTLMLVLPLAAWVAVSAYPWFLKVIKLINNMPV